MSDTPVLQVVAAVLRDGEGRVLISQRPAGKKLAGYWEFPGGKLLAGEPQQAALARELREELAVDVRSSHWLISLKHDYPDQRVELAVWEIDEYVGQPRSMEEQALKWVMPVALYAEQLLPADAPIVEILNRR